MLPRIRVSGTARERGQQHGAAARDRINAGVDLYTGWFRDFGRVSWNEATRLVDPYVEILGAEHPEVLEELRGIAEGAGRPLADIVALNARTEIAYSTQSPAAAMGECTSFAVRPEAAADGHLYVGENWDWLPEALDNAIILEAALPDGGSYVTFTEAGMLAKFGVNSAGISLCNNLLATDRNQPGALFHTLSSEVLRSTSLLAAMWAVTSATRAGSGNYLIGSAADADAVDVEWSPGDFNAIFPTGGVLAHANHFTGGLTGQRDRTKFLSAVSPGTYMRQRRAEELLALSRDSGGVTPQALRTILRDHRYAPEAICRHRAEADGRRILGQTNVSVIFDLTASTMEWTAGPPCEAAYHSEPLPWAARAVAGQHQS